jgi:hypothetical protein
MRGKNYFKRTVEQFTFRRFFYTVLLSGNFKKDCF